jgi:putative transposase
VWIENTEGAKFWMKVFNDLRTRGVTDILIAVTDGLKGMPQALEVVFPRTTLQTCDAFEAGEAGEWGRKFPTVVAAWRRAWDQVIPFFSFPPEIRRVIYTTNAIESVNASGKSSRRGAIFPPTTRQAS